MHSGNKDKCNGESGFKKLSLHCEALSENDQ